MLILKNGFDDYKRGKTLLMSISTLTQPQVTYEEVVNLLATLPLERLNSVYDFVLFLKYQPLVPIPETDIFGATQEEIREDEERWNQQFAESRGKLRVLAHEASEEFRSGRTKPMQFPSDGKLAR
jgi:hypothetical protein